MDKQLTIALFTSSDFIFPIIESIKFSENTDLITSAKNQLSLLIDKEERGELSIVNSFKDTYLSLFEKFERELSLPIGKILIITQPDKNLRGKLIKNVISRYSSEHSIDLYQQEKIRDNPQECIEALQEFGVSIGIVCSFGQILPSEVLNFFEYGCINWHPSLLPLYRGASPVQSQLLDRATTTGLSWIEMDSRMDAGDILLQTSRTINTNENSQSLLTSMGLLGSQTWSLAVTGSIAYTKLLPQFGIIQDHSKATFTKIIEKQKKQIKLTDITTRDLIAHHKAFIMFPGTVFYSGYFESDVRIDTIDYSQTTPLTTKVYSDDQFVQDANRRVFLKTSDGYVRVTAMTLLNSGKKIDLRGFEFVM